MSGDDWDEEKTKMKVKSALISLCASEGTFASSRDIINRLKDTGYQTPPYQTFGYRNLSELMRQYPDFFISMGGDNWKCNENCLTANDLSIIRDLQISNASKNKKGGGRAIRGFAPRGGRAGVASRGGYGVGFGNRPQASNNARAPGFMSASTARHSQHDDRLDAPQSKFDNYPNDNFSGRGSAFYKPNGFGAEDSYEERRPYNEIPRRGSPERCNNSRNGYNDVDDSRRRNDYPGRDYEGYPRQSYNQSPSANGSASNECNRYDNFQENRYPRSESYRNVAYGGFDQRHVDNRRRSPSPIRRSESAYYPPPAPSPPPGMASRYNTPRDRHTPPPGLVPDSYVRNEVSVGPPPGLNEINARPVNLYEQRPHSAASEGSIAAVDTGKMTIGNVAQNAVSVLSQVWPKSLELRELVDYPGIFPAGSADNYTEESIEINLAKILKRLSKPEFKEYVHIDKEGDKTFLTYNVNIDNDPDRTPEHVFKVATNYLSNGSQSLTRLAQILGIKNKGGILGAAELLGFFNLVPNYKEIAKVEKALPSNIRTVSLVENAKVEPWQPKLHGSLSTERLPPPPSPKPIPSPSHGRATPDFHTMFQAAKLLANNTAPKYFKGEYLPFFNILQCNGLPKDFDKVYKKGIISNFVDFNNFWIRTEDDEHVFYDLREELIEYYKACGEAKVPKEGQMVAACRWNDSENWWYVRGVILEKSRKFALVKNIDEGGVLRVRVEDIFPLPEYFRKLPPLATRCSIGTFGEMTEKEKNDLDDEEHDIGEIILRRTVSFKLRNIIEDEHVLVDVEVPMPGGARVKYIPQEYSQFMADI